MSTPTTNTEPPSLEEFTAYIERTLTEVELQWQDREGESLEAWIGRTDSFPRIRLAARVALEVLRADT